VDDLIAALTSEYMQRIVAEKRQKDQHIRIIEQQRRLIKLVLYTLPVSYHYVCDR